MDGADLTEREREVLRLLATGIGNKAIAAGLGITESTVEGHLTGIYRKLGARGRVQAVTAALRLGLIEPPPPLDQAA